MTFSRGLLQEIKKCVEIRCWSLAPSNSLGPFSTEKKASASSLLWPANYFFHPWVHLPYLPGEEGGGGGRDTPCGLYREAPPERGAFLRLQVYERVGKFVISVFEGP